ncbi:DUF4272 domain-containing protein [Comamonas serinivorans]|nr:DUF4272 domain-containing protein [Comamonas serinivorans]
MWKRLRLWLSPSPPAPDDAAPHIEPGLDAPSATDQAAPEAGPHHPDLLELGDAYASALPGGPQTARADTEPVLSHQADADPADLPVPRQVPLDLAPGPADLALDPPLNPPADGATDTPPRPATPRLLPVADASLDKLALDPVLDPTLDPPLDAVPPLAAEPAHASVAEPTLTSAAEPTRAPIAEPVRASAVARQPMREVEPTLEPVLNLAPDPRREPAHDTDAPAVDAPAPAAPPTPTSPTVAATASDRGEPAWSEAWPDDVPAHGLPAHPAERREPGLHHGDAEVTPWPESRLDPYLPSQLPLDALDTTGEPVLTDEAAAPARQAPTPAPTFASAPAAVTAAPVITPLTAPAAPAIAPVPAPPALARAPEDQPVLVHVFATLREGVSPPFASLTLEHLDTRHPEMAEHLTGLMRYVQGRNPADMTPRRHALWRHLQRVQHVWRLTLMPAQLEALGQWAGAVNGVVALPDGSVRDPKGYVLLAAPGGSDDALARLPHPADAWQRKRASEALMRARGWRVSASLPPVAGAGEVSLRTVPDVVGRALALVLVAARAESLAAGGGDALTPDRLRQRLPAALAHLSPNERQFLDTAAPTQAQVVAMGWRYEALHGLLWALGLLDDLPWPQDVCNVAQCVALLLDANLDRLAHDASLRPASDILDQLDLHMRLHWLLRDSELQGQTAPQALRRGVVMERHQVLNWLIAFEQADWDKVGTPT